MVDRMILISILTSGNHKKGDDPEQTYVITYYIVDNKRSYPKFTLQTLNLYVRDNFRYIV